MFEANALDISTHYYKIGHLSSVNYSIYTTNAGNDQSLLELELSIRYHNPKILITYYNKCLFYFTFGHTSQHDIHNIPILAQQLDQQPKVFDQPKEHPSLILKHSNKVSAEHLANPPKPSSSESSDEFLPLASMSFLKAVKKMVLYNLSATGSIHLFGNYSIVQSDHYKYSILYLDSILLPDGDLLISIIVKHQVSLFDSSVLKTISLSPSNPIDFNFAIYLIPSGIRCHLLDTVDFSKNFIEKPNENENLLKLINLSIGIDHFSDKDELVWVKLIPNLKHLNNQTSPISKFIHSVDNKKFILWPWSLCLLQFGKFESVQNQKELTDNVNPMDLISEFIDFNITNNQSSQQASHFHNQSSNQPFSIFSGGMSSGANGVESTGPTADLSHKKDIGSTEIQDLTTPVGATDLFSLQNDEFFNKEDFNAFKPNQAQEAKEEFENNDNMEIDDLFGDDGSDDIAEPANKVEVEENNANVPLDVHDDESSQPETLTDSLNDPIINDQANEQNDQIPADINLLDNTNSAQADNSSSDAHTTKEAENSSHDRGFPAKFASKLSYIDIPKDQMMLKFNTPNYNDPGAPLPIVPTPVIPQMNFGAMTHANSAPSTSNVPPEDEKSRQKSIFSPIIFNPIIKSNIDTKYGKGGKFYVDKESSTDPEMGKKKRNIRATSVSGYDIPFKDTLNDEEKGQQLSNTTVLSFEESSGSDSSEESDVDEEMAHLPNSPALKLNTEEQFYPTEMLGNEEQNSSIAPVNHGLGVGIRAFEHNSQDKSVLSNYISGSLDSPGSSRIPPLKGESPSFGGDLQNTISPMDNTSPSQGGQTQGQLFPNQPSQHTPSNNQSTPTPLHTPSNQWQSKTENVKIGEASNYLPLILRNINVSTIPNVFLLNNHISENDDNLVQSFSINDDENDNDLELSKRNEMTIKMNHLDEFLEFLGPNLIFDLGLNSKRPRMKYYTSNEEIKSSTPLEQPLDYKQPSTSFSSKFMEIFPNAYKVKLSEFLRDYKINKDNEEDDLGLNSQLNFLGDITVDVGEDLMNPTSLVTKLKSLEWDCINDSEENKEVSTRYKSIMDRLAEKNETEFGSELEDVYFKLPTTKARILKHQNILNLNTVGLNFWKYLNFSPLKSIKNFQILLIGEDNGRGSFVNEEFLNSLITNYNENNLGTISKVKLSTIDNRNDLESIHDGQILINTQNEVTFNEICSQINNRLNSLVELIKLDLINKTNNFEFDRPLCLLLVNSSPQYNSILQISKIFRNFKTFLANHQLPLVKIFTKIIPDSFFVKKGEGQLNQLRILPNYQVTKLSLNLYNQCPVNTGNGSGVGGVGGTKDASIKSLAGGYGNCFKLYTQLVKEPPSKIQFKFLNTNSKDSNFNDDIFLHLAYERSIDKNWFSAAWSDPLGAATFTKSWYCSTRADKNDNRVDSGSRNVYDLGSISDEIWNISSDIFRKLNDDINKASGGGNGGGKKFLVLTRVNSIIPDDELVHWKRLSIKHKDISLIVLSVHDSTKVLFTDSGKSAPSQIGGNLSAAGNGNVGNAVVQPPPSSAERDSSAGFNSSPLITSPSMNFHSPQQFLNAPSNFLSPQEYGSNTSGGNTSATGARNGGTTEESNPIPDSVIHELDSDIMGVIPRVPVPSFNSPNRLGMKIGYLMKKVANEEPEEQEQEQEQEQPDSKIGSYLVFEVNLLSCSNYWDLEVLMKLILNHYKKLVVLNDILGTRAFDGNINMYDLDCESKKEHRIQKLSYEVSGLVPWHIMSVTKSLDYLTHIYVEE